MPQPIRESRPAPPQPNIQDVFLNYARREKLPVHIRLMDGTDFEGRVKNFDRFAVIVEHNGADHMVFKHAIATIRSPRTMGNYYSTPRADEPAPSDSPHGLLTLDSVCIASWPMRIDTSIEAATRSQMRSGAPARQRCARRPGKLVELGGPGGFRTAGATGGWRKRRPQGLCDRHWELRGSSIGVSVFPTLSTVDRAFERAAVTILVNKPHLTAIIASSARDLRRAARSFHVCGHRFQIAAHEDVIPVPELYRICRIAYDLVGLGQGVGRVIARPFIGVPGAFKRTPNRRDFALTPFAPTLLDRIKDAGLPVVAIGKIEDLSDAAITPFTHQR